MKASANHDEIVASVARLALTVRAFEQELDTLDSETARLKASWDGEAQQAYDRAQHRWNVAIRTMKDLLAEATRRLITVNAISMETSAAAARVWT